MTLVIPSRRIRMPEPALPASRFCSGRAVGPPPGRSRDLPSTGQLWVSLSAACGSANCLRACSSSDSPQVRERVGQADVEAAEMLLDEFRLLCVVRGTEPLRKTSGCNSMVAPNALANYTAALGCCGWTVLKCTCQFLARCNRGASPDRHELSSTISRWVGCGQGVDKLPGRAAMSYSPFRMVC